VGSAIICHSHRQTAVGAVPSGLGFIRSNNNEGLSIKPYSPDGGQRVEDKYKIAPSRVVMSFRGAEFDPGSIANSGD
jgi:hypothetical protein